MPMNNEVERIKRIIAYYKRIYDTSDPFKIADFLGVLYQYGNCKFAGCYMFLKNHRYIFLSNELGETERKLEIKPFFLSRNLRKERIYLRHTF